MILNTLRRRLVTGSLLPCAFAALAAAGRAQSSPAASPTAAPSPAAAPAAASAPPAGNADPAAGAVAGAVMQGLGGQAAWDATHFIHFTFAGRRTHTWDKWTGRHRLEGKTKEGESYVVLDNLNTHQGTAYLNGKLAEGEQAKKLVDNAYGAWVNDTYWLLMPYKLKDPGVNLSLAGQDQIDGKSYDKLALSFGQVGLTPGDHYWAWINRDTHLMDRWAYVLQDQPKDAAPTVWLWQGWQRYGKIMLAPTRVKAGGDGRLELSNIEVPETVPDTVFTAP
ncbi:MAG TPA: hypothetical protein VHR45_12515 [Thermoanaerobaculia bacterium]|nr:hypothetical protein [Thermoanaerobaculia bacterium]